MPAFLLDTDVLIDISRGNSAAADFVDALAGDLFISRISAMELIVGARNKRDQKVIESGGPKGELSAEVIAELRSVARHNGYSGIRRLLGNLKCG